VEVAVARETTGGDASAEDVKRSNSDQPTFRSQQEAHMAEQDSKVPVREAKETLPSYGLFEEPFRRAAPDLEPFGRLPLWASSPAVDLVEKDKEYEITAELPGLDEKNVQVKLSDSTLTISGEKKEEREEKERGYHLSERRYGAFRRAFRIPEGVDRERIEASFGKGVLTIKLPKSSEGHKPEKIIDIKAS
jgi:HSP20 family protein